MEKTLFQKVGRTSSPVINIFCCEINLGTNDWNNTFVVIKYPGQHSSKGERKHKQWFKDFHVHVRRFYTLKLFNRLGLYRNHQIPPRKL